MVITSPTPVAMSLEEFRKDVVINVLDLQGQLALSYKLRLLRPTNRLRPRFDSNGVATGADGGGRGRPCADVGGIRRSRKPLPRIRFWTPTDGGGESPHVARNEQVNGSSPFVGSIFLFHGSRFRRRRSQRARLIVEGRPRDGRRPARRASADEQNHDGEADEPERNVGLEVDALEALEAPDVEVRPAPLLEGHVGARAAEGDVGRHPGQQSEDQAERVLDVRDVADEAGGAQNEPSHDPHRVLIGRRGPGDR